MEAEVTGIIPLLDRRAMLTVGWSRVITEYPDTEPDVSGWIADSERLDKIIK